MEEEKEVEAKPTRIKAQGIVSEDQEQRSVVAAQTLYGQNVTTVILLPCSKYDN